MTTAIGILRLKNMSNFTERLISQWHEGDHQMPLYEFLHLTPEQYSNYVEGRLSDSEVEVIYRGQSARNWEWLPEDGKHDYEE